MTLSTASEKHSDQRLFRRYAPLPGLRDEFVDESGALRSHWHLFVALLDDMGPQEIRHRWDQAKRLIHDNGVTYNVYGDPRGMQRPWSLDTIPLLISTHDWQTIQAGLVQRAKLLDMVLGDLYGRQMLVAEGLIPAQLVYGSRGFLRPLHASMPPGGRWLHFYAADLARASDGNWCVLGDRAQSPSGAGYALENRVVLQRAIPDIFRDCHVQRLAVFFRAVQKTLAQLAPRNTDNPRIVLLTPGPYNETYFEHAYLARYLGYTLVEGGDLTVRDQRVFLKTLGGLQPVDVILRRLDDDYCDPLELKPDSTLGIPGLVQAVHAKNVAVANALGSGLVETAAIKPLLPALCRRLLGEDLKLPSVPTYWCGDSEGLKYVLSNLPRMVIKGAYPQIGREPVFCQGLTRAQLDDLAGRIRAHPTMFMGQPQMDMSTAPVLADDDRLEPRRVVLRSHCIADGDGYAVMPGGLARFGAAADSLVVSMQRGGGSKDAWVLADGPVDPFSLLSPAGQPVALSRGGGDLPSRVADNLFWLGRYVERAESLARLTRGVSTRVIELSGTTPPVELVTLYAALLSQSLIVPVAGDGPETLEAGVLNAAMDDGTSGSLKSTIHALHRNARIVRDRISMDTWRIVNALEQDFLSRTEDDGPMTLGWLQVALDRMVVTLAGFGGLAMDSMTRGQAWRFLDMGRRLERALQTARLLRQTAVTPSPRQESLLESLLEVLDSAMTYRRRYLTSMQVHAVLDLVLCDESNPRSVAFALAALSDHVDNLPRDVSSPKRTPEQAIVLECLTTLRLLDVAAEGYSGRSGGRQKLDALLKFLAEKMAALSDAIGQSYLSHATVTRQITGTSPIGVD